MILISYARKSVVDDTAPTPSISPERQHHAVADWNERYGPQYNNGQPFIIEQYQDVGISGRFEANRPAWQEVLQRVTSPDVWGVAVEDYRATHRNLYEFLGFFDNTLAPLGKQLKWVYFPHIDFSTADGRWMASSLMANAEWESRKAGERTAGHIHEIINNETRHWGTIPFGCNRHPVNKQLIPSTSTYLYHPATGQARAANLGNPEEIPSPGWEIRRYLDTLQFIFETYATGRHSYSDVAILCRRAGYHCWQTDRITPQPVGYPSVRSYVVNWQIYAGDLPPSRRMPDRPYHQDAHPPILDPDLCRRVGQAFQQRSKVRSPNSIKKPAKIYPLTGVLYCANCGSKMCGAGRGDRKCGFLRLYGHLDTERGCTKTHLAQDIERKIIAMLVRVAQQESIIQDLTDQARQTFRQARTTDPAGTQQKIDQHNAELERLIDLHVSGHISKEQFLGRQQTIQAKLAELETKTAATNVVAELEYYLKNIRPAIAALTAADPARQKTLICNIIQRAEVNLDGQIVVVTPHEWAKSLFKSIAH